MSAGQGAGQSVGRLYTSEILGLAVELANYPINKAQTLHAEVRSRSCGSTLAISIDASQNKSIRSIGLQVSACAIGQASAAIFAESGKGKTKADLMQALNALEAWLANDADVPDWPKLVLLVDAKAYPARHEAILLPWRAAIAALSKAETHG
ncbi:iron-sulfur cluster assembly scaffold protein [Pontixanthobacter aestiaquae]|uniref:Iron-sulfur cluster assembly scaffold protein n=1 Tax=Pontixanthobacter aestiaquae TaxID=1509367 RepID=A0A844Z7U7_9SPHN|nr:iron-sulfur cluster assembly scaffold protein [Pontixanthobacter aestiaquae]MDN3645416.1 iron-sulfur cluster assembly scaffold protein [Pontixanthobacter aestiaquae]MXO83584.1 iron-sulfur cluster assembly scaffold protein [Pontixanthobacter aestiaquae]